MTAPVHHTTRTDTADVLLPVLHRALEAHAFDDDGDPHGRTPAGRALLDLARWARAAAADLGADPGTTLSDGSGVVVLRELAAATRLLTRAADGARTADVTQEPLSELATAGC
jgi:hypothetical protein